MVSKEEIKSVLGTRNVNEYIQWVDIFKGICIILMVLGHATVPFVTYIYLFHMPAFIVISGYTYTGEKYKFLTYLKKKVLTLLVPMICINLLYILFYVLLQKVGLYQYFQNGDEISFLNRINIMFRWLGTPDFGGATWFLFVLFSIEIIYKIIDVASSYFKIKNLDVIISFLIAFIGWFIISKGHILSYNLDLSLFGLCFFGIGVILKRINNINRYIDKKVMLAFSIIATVFFGSFYFKSQLPMNWPTRQFASLPIQLLSSLCAIYLCYTVSKLLEISKIFSSILIYIGKRTYIILVFHFFAFRIIFGILILLKIFPLDYLKELTPRYSNGFQWLFITIISIIICLLVSYIFQWNKITNFIFNARTKLIK